MGVETNITVAAKVATKIDNSFDTFAQQLLVSVYKEIPFLGYNLFGVTYGQIVVAVALFVLILFIRPLFVSLLIKFALKLTSKTETRYDDRVVKNLQEPLKFLFLIFRDIYFYICPLYPKRYC